MALKIKKGDTFNDLAKKYNTTVPALVSANPGINVNNLQIGQEIQLPATFEIKTIEPKKLSFVDFIKEIPSGIKQTGEKILKETKEFGQSSLRAYAGLGGLITGETLTPETPFQKELYGTEKPITLKSVGAELGLKEDSKISPFAGFALGAADLIPGGKVTKSAAVKLLKNANKADDAFKVLTKTMGVSSDVAKKYTETAAKLTDANELSSLVDEVVAESQKISTMVKKGKDILTKPRGFTKSAKEVIPQAERIAGQYIPRSTDQLAIKAKNLIRDDFATAEKIALTGSDDNAVAVASELLKKYADDAAKATDPAMANALYDKAAEVANTLAPKLTEQGRAIQAASILGKLTPEGQVRFAAREIQRYNETAPLNKKLKELTGEQAKSITDEMKAINEMTDGTEKAMRFQNLQNTIQDLVPTPFAKKWVAVWKAGLLTGLKTTGLNVFSNLSHAVTEVAKDVPAVVVDNVASLFTGERTKTLTLRKAFDGIKEGAVKGKRYFYTGFDERNIGAKLDYHRVGFGSLDKATSQVKKGKVAKFFQGYTDTVFRALGTEDQPFYYSALARSLMDQALAQGKNAGKKGKELVAFAEDLVQSPTEEMIRYGVTDATTAVFQNKTTLGEAARNVQKIPVVGEFVLPFSRTPSAVAMQIINYSPVGIAKTIFENARKGRFDQRLFSQGIGRGLTGTAVLALGAYLGKKRLITLDYPQGNEKEQELQKAEGVKNNAVKVDGKWRDPLVLGPMGSLLLFGAHFQKAIEEHGSPTGAFVQASLGGAKSFMEHTFLTGIKDAVNALTDPERYGKTYLPNLVASHVPTIVSDVARSTDPLERRTSDGEFFGTVKDRVQARTPGVRNKLEPQIDILGKERKSIGNPLEILLDPTRPSPDTQTPVTKELRRLTNEGYKVSPTMLGDRSGYDSLSPEENTRLWKFAGGIINDKLTSLFGREEYKSLDDEQKGKVVEKVVDQAKLNARVGIAIELTDGLEGEELKSKLSELKAGGLLTKEVFSKYLELR